eukprot:3006414-Rhodomonas_salina.1
MVFALLRELTEPPCWHSAQAIVPAQNYGRPKPTLIVSKNACAVQSIYSTTGLNADPCLLGSLPSYCRRPRPGVP